LNTDILIEKLSLQVHSFQESFEMLSNSPDLEKMAIQFNRILKGTLLTTDINIFHSATDKSEWRTLFAKSEDKKSLLNEIDSSEQFIIDSNENSSEVYIITQLIDESYLGIIIGERLDKTPYSDFDKITVQIYVQLFDNSYQAYLSRKKEKELIFSLNHKVLQLNNLIDTGIEVTKLDLGDQMLELALERGVALTNASKGFLRITKQGELIKEISFPPEIDNAESSENTLSKKFTEQGLEYEFILVDKETRKGIIDFDTTDELLLGAISRQVQAAIVNEELHREALENETIKKELAVAGEIQKRILPESLPEINGYLIAGINIPSKEVSGDYYNVFPLKDSRYALIVADVTGKGVPASLLVSTLDASLQSYLDLQIPLPEMAVKINTLIYKASTVDKFITFFIAILEPESGELDIVNAGHNPTLLLKKDGSFQKIDAGGMAFGMFDMGFPFEGEKITLKKGERLFLYTDGIPEAMDPDDEEYSDEKMESFFTDVKPEDPEEFIEKIVDDVKSFTKGTPQSDDITAVYLIRKE